MFCNASRINWWPENICWTRASRELGWTFAMLLGKMLSMLENSRFEKPKRLLWTSNEASQLGRGHEIHITFKAHGGSAELVE